MNARNIIAGIAATGVIAGGGSVTADQLVNPYTTVGTNMDIVASSTLPAAGNDQITIDTTKPEITLSKWSGQVNMGITYMGMASTTAGSRPFLSKDVQWSSGSQTMQVVPLSASSTYEDGGYEINLILNSEPATNTFQFAISDADQLDVFYQPPLWQEAGLNAPTALCTDTVCNTDGEGTSTRPDNVVGSYAVYYANHANHIEGQTNYATGKAYQIFRPLVTDANGASTWATLSYSHGALTVAVPQSFLDSAAYPVTIDPTFGYTTHGGTQLTGLNSAGTTLIASLVGGYIASTGDAITNYSFWGNLGNAVLVNFDFAAFSVVAGVVTNQLADKTYVTVSSQVDQLWTSTTTISQSPVAGTQYAVSASSQDIPTGGPSLSLDYDAGSAPGRFNSTLFSFPGAGSSFSPTGTDSGRHYSLYATYTSGGGGSSPSGFGTVVRFQ